MTDSLADSPVLARSGFQVGQAVRPPSQTALTAAAARAAHLIVDGAPVIFADSLAATLLGDQADTFIDYHRNHGSHLVLAGARVQTTLRSRVAEGRVTAGVATGIAQYVILGAGLDTFAYRSAGTDGDGLSGVRVFEVDHPASQQWKRRCLTDAGIEIPQMVAYVGVDFETDSLLDELKSCGFDISRPAVVSWLGVTVYLTRPAITATLDIVGRLAPGSELVLDYILPEDLRDGAGASYAELVAPSAAERGEPWLTFFMPDEMTRLLVGCGFGHVTHLGQRAVDPTLWDRTDDLRPANLSVIACATITA